MGAECQACKQPSGLLGALPDIVSTAVGAIPGAGVFAAPLVKALTQALIAYFGDEDAEVRLAPLPSINEVADQVISELGDAPGG